MDSNIEDNIEEFTKQEEYSWIDNFNKRSMINITKVLPKK